MATTRFQNNDMRRQVGSPRPKTRGSYEVTVGEEARRLHYGLAENKETLCRNVLIYGHCRYEDQGCTFNHEQNKNNSSQLDAYVEHSSISTSCGGKGPGTRTNKICLSTRMVAGNAKQSFLQRKLPLYESLYQWRISTDCIRCLMTCSRRRLFFYPNVAQSMKHYPSLLRCTERCSFNKQVRSSVTDG